MKLTMSNSTRVFFKTVHNLLPMINQNLFKATSETWSPALDALTCLRYAMWTVAASMQPAQNPHLQSQLYAHARALLEACEVKLHSQNHVPIEQAQAWILLSLYELTSVSFQRGFLSVGRCYRLVHMMGLSEVDVTSSSMYGPLHCCDTNASSTETEVRRRTFWSAYLLDRFMSFSTPSLWMSIDTCTVVRSNALTRDSATTIEGLIKACRHQRDCQSLNFCSSKNKYTLRNSCTKRLQPKAKRRLPHSHI